MVPESDQHATTHNDLTDADSAALDAALAETMLNRDTGTCLGHAANHLPCAGVNNRTPKDGGFVLASPGVSGAAHLGGLRPSSPCRSVSV